MARSFAVKLAICLLPALAHAQLFVTNSASNTIGKYDAITGATINAAFITGLHGPGGIALLGSTLYVTNTSDGTIGTYDANTGATISASFITGLADPFALVISGSNLFVENEMTTGSVGVYNATTGATISASFVAGLDFPFGLTVSGSELLVSVPRKSDVGEFDASTGTTISASFGTWATTPDSLLISGSTLYESNNGNSAVGTYDAGTGAVINPTFITGIGSPRGMVALGPNLLVADFNNDTIGEYNATTGAAISTTFVTGLSEPRFIAVEPVAATVLLATLSQSYTGGPCAATATTNPGGLNVGFTYNGSTTAPTNVGSYTVVATINAPNCTGTATGTLIIQPDFASYLAGFFNPAQLADPTVSGPTANPAGDGMPNLLKYALGLDPTQDEAVTGAPVVGKSGGALTLTYVCPPGLSDITYIVEVSGDLQTWSSGPSFTSVLSTTPLDALHEQVVVQDLTPTNGLTCRFIRLRVTQP